MSRIKSANTKPEIILRHALWAKGLRYRINYRVEKVRPDVVFTKAKIAIFVDGCQWHGCPEHYVKPRTRDEFWSKKLKESIERDIAQTDLLTSKGWLVYRAWEHEIWENLPNITETILKILETKQVETASNFRVFKVEKTNLENEIEKRYMLDLSFPETIKIIERKRSTKKWKREKFCGQENGDNYECTSN